MKRPFRLAAVDLDDTLLGPDHQISARNAEAVRMLTEGGVQVVIASGRMHASTTAFADQLGLHGPILSYNGALVKEHGTGEIYHHVRVPAELAAEMVNYAEERGLPLNYYLNDRLYINEEVARSEQGRWHDLYRSRTKSVMHPVGSLRQFEGEEPTKMILLGDPEDVKRWAPEFHERYEGRLNVLISNVEYLEFMNPQVSKAYGLESIGKRLGISAEEMIAFGDSGNDIAMLQYVGFGVAMGNARPEVKEVADYVGSRNDEDGFALAVDACIELVR